MENQENNGHCSGEGTFKKNGDIEYYINLYPENPNNKYDFFASFDISNSLTNGVVLLVKPEIANAESQEGLKKHKHKFKIKDLKPYKHTTGFNLNKTDAFVAVINCNATTDEVLNLIEHYYKNLSKLFQDITMKPVTVGTGIIRRPLLE